MKVAVAPLVVGALGTPVKALEKRLKTIGIETKVTEWQKTVLKTGILYITVEYSKMFLRCEESCCHHTSRKKHIRW